MRIFQRNQLALAIDFSEQGGQSLHLHRIIANRAKAPVCFRKAIARGENIGHLFDNDRERLVRTACGLGVKVIVVERIGKPGQHIDLCGVPLMNAVLLCEKECDI